MDPGAPKEQLWGGRGLGDSFLGLCTVTSGSNNSRTGFHRQELSGTDPVHKPFGTGIHSKTVRYVLGRAEKNGEKTSCFCFQKKAVTAIFFAAILP